MPSHLAPALIKKWLLSLPLACTLVALFLSVFPSQTQDSASVIMNRTRAVKGSLRLEVHGGVQRYATGPLTALAS